MLRPLRPMAHGGWDDMEVVTWLALIAFELWRHKIASRAVLAARKRACLEAPFMPAIPSFESIRVPRMLFVPRGTINGVPIKP